jgi:dephospho-CoA kinase|tara:strand:- start:691 stop:1266 length:576 start_codon:yes stop_codon:yes gene_type:complete
MIKIGLTGSIGMGKTTTAGIFVKHGCALWDADKTVHKLYSKGGIAVKAVSKLFPTSVENGSISRNKLKVLLKKKPEKLKELEKIVHPLIQADRQDFQNQNIADIAVFDIPLLFETGLDKEMDKTVCVFTSAKNQIERLKKRTDNSDNYYKELISKQMPSEEKCKLSDFTIETTSHEMVEEKVMEILNMLRV